MNRRHLLQAAAAALKADANLRELVVRCVSRIPDEQGGEENVIIFRARVSRESLQKWSGQGTMPTIEELRGGVLGEIWWDQDALSRHVKTEAKAPGGG